MADVETAPAGQIADAPTLERARLGDSDALADLWTIYQPRLLSMLRKRGRSSAEDITSQVWIDVGRNIARFVGDGDDFARWVYTIATRRAIDETRRAVRRHEIVVATESMPRPRYVNNNTLGDSLDGVLALLQTLQPAAAEIVMLRVVEDLPVAEVAEITGKSESHVRVIAHRALHSLRQTLEEATALAPRPTFEPLAI
jgi:RNA polymerase sigma-70 factor (ECF subfamily)